MHVRCPACVNFLNSIGYGSCCICHRVGKTLTKCCGNYVSSVPQETKMKTPRCYNEHYKNMNIHKSRITAGNHQENKLRQPTRNINWINCMNKELRNLKINKKQASTQKTKKNKSKLTNSKIPKDDKLKGPNSDKITKKKSTELRNRRKARKNPEKINKCTTNAMNSGKTKSQRKKNVHKTKPKLHCNYEIHNTWYHYWRGKYE